MLDESPLDESILGKLWPLPGPSTGKDTAEHCSCVGQVQETWGCLQNVNQTKKTGLLLVDHRFFSNGPMAIFDGASNGEQHQWPYYAIFDGQMGYEKTPFWDKPAWGSAKTLYMAGCFCFVMQWSQQNIASKSAVESSVEDQRFRNSQKVTHQIIRFEHFSPFLPWPQPLNLLVALLSALWKVQGCATSWSPALALRNSPSSCAVFAICQLISSIQNWPGRPGTSLCCFQNWDPWNRSTRNGRTSAKDLGRINNSQLDKFPFINDLPTKHADLFKQKYESWIDAHRLSYQKNGDLPKLWISECQAELPVVPVPFSPSKGSPVVSSRSANGSCLDVMQKDLRAPANPCIHVSVKSRR